MSIQNIKKLLHVQCIRMGNGDKIIVRRHTEFSVLHVYSGERRLRRSSENILFFSSDGRSLAGGGAESYRYPPAGGSSPELRVLTQRLSDNPTESDNQSSLSSLGSLTLTNRKSIRKAREGLFFLSNLSVIFCVT